MRPRPVAQRPYWVPPDGATVAFGDCCLDGFAASPALVGLSVAWRVLFPLADRFAALPSRLPLFADGLASGVVTPVAPFVAEGVAPFVVAGAVPVAVGAVLVAGALSGLMPVLPASPLGLVDSDCASTPAESEPERPLGPWECAIEIKVSGSAHAATATSLFIVSSG